MAPPGSGRPPSAEDVFRELREQHESVLGQMRSALSELAAVSAGARGMTGTAGKIRETERALKDVGRAAGALELATRELGKVQSAGDSILRLDQRFRQAGTRPGGLLGLLARGGRGGGALATGAGMSLGLGGLALLGAGLGIGVGALGAMGSIVGSGLDVARQWNPLRQRLRALGGAGALQGLGDKAHLGYSSLDVGQLRQGLMQAVGTDDVGGRERRRLGALEQTVMGAERGFGLEQSSSVGLFGAMRRSGQTFEGGHEGAQALRKVIADAFVSGIEKTRLGEYLAGVEGLLQAEQTHTAGGVLAQNLSRMLGLLGGSAQPGLQGAYGAQALAQLSQGIRSPGGGDAGRSITLMALQRGTYTRTHAAMEEGATPENLGRLYEHMRKTYGLSGEVGAHVSEEAVLRLSQMTGVGLSKLAGKDFKDTGKVGEGSLLAMMHRIASGPADGKERADLEAKIEAELADPTRNIEKHTQKRAETTERLLEVGEKWLEGEDSIQSLLAEKVYPTLADMGSGVMGLVKELVGDRAQKEELARAVDRLASRATEASTDLEGARTVYAQSGKTEHDRAALAGAVETYNRRTKALRSRLDDVGPEAAQQSLSVDTGALGKLRELWRQPGTFAANAGIGAVNTLQGSGGFLMNTPSKLWKWDLDDESIWKTDYVRPYRYDDESLPNPGARRMSFDPVSLDDAIAGRLGSARTRTGGGLPAAFPEELAAFAARGRGVAPDEQARREAMTHRSDEARPSAREQARRMSFAHQIDMRVFVNDTAVQASAVTAPTTSVLQGVP